MKLKYDAKRVFGTETRGTEMNELIKVLEHEMLVQAVGARELYEGLGLASAVWARWAETNIEQNSFFSQGIDFVQLNTMLSSESPNPAKDYAITLEFAKHIAMMAKTPNAHDYRNYFIACEKALRESQALMLPQTYLEALKALVLVTEEKERIQAERELLRVQLEQSREWYSIKRMAKLNHMDWRDYSWRKLKSAGVVVGHAPKQIFDANYGEVNTYHKAAWNLVYPGLEFDKTEKILSLVKL